MSLAVVFFARGLHRRTAIACLPLLSCRRMVK